MDLVIGDNNWVSDLFSFAPKSLLKEEFSEEQILSMRDRHMAWCAKQLVGANDATQSPPKLSSIDSEILKAQKKAKQAFLELTLHQISFSGLLEFRRFHSSQPTYKLKV